MSASDYKVDGALRRDRIIAKKRAAVNLVEGLPDEMSRIDSDALIAAVALLDNIRRRVARDRKAARERYEVPAAS